MNAAESFCHPLFKGNPRNGLSFEQNSTWNKITKYLKRLPAQAFCSKFIQASTHPLVSTLFTLIVRVALSVSLCKFYRIICHRVKLLYALLWAMNFLPSLAKYQVSKSQQKRGGGGGGRSVWDGRAEKHLLLKKSRALEKGNGAYWIQARCSAVER